MTSNLVREIIDIFVEPTPGKPGNFVAVTGAADNTIDTTWTAASGTVTTYIVEYKPDFGDTFIAVDAGDVLSFTIPNLASGITYICRVTAHNGPIQGLPSDEDTALVVGVPEKVTVFSTFAQIKGLNSVWAAPTASPAITSYEFEFKKNTDPTFTVVPLGAAVFSNTEIGLEGGVLYDTRIRAVNSKGNGEYSDVEQITATALGVNTVVEWNDLGVDLTTPITFVTNTGTGGSQYDLNVVVGNGANLTAQVRNSKPCWQSSGVAALRTTAPPTDINAPYSFIGVLLPFFVDGNSRFLYNGSFDSANAKITNSTHSVFSGATLNSSVAGAASVEVLMLGEVNGASSSVRVIKNDGSTDVTTFGNAGSNKTQPEILLWDFSQSANSDLPAQVYEWRFYDGILTAAEKTAEINELTAKWF